MSYEIELTKGLRATVDAEDALLLVPYRWSALLSRSKNTEKYYAGRWDGERRRYVLMHRVIMKEPVGLIVDHRDGDTLNNRKSNLRSTTQTLNLLNQDRQTGIHKRKDNGRFMAYIIVGGSRRNLGNYATYEEALAARVLAEKELGL